MTAAVALAVVLAIAVAGVSLAMQTQRPTGTNPVRPRPTPPTPRRPRERRPQPAAQNPPSPPPTAPKPERAPKGPELLRTGTKASARVVSVVDERTVGPVTRSRLTLEITPEQGEAFEVTTRTAFPSPAARAAVKVGGRVPVRYDPADHGRVALDLPRDERPASSADEGDSPGDDSPPAPPGS